MTMVRQNCASHPSFLSGWGTLSSRLIGENRTEGWLPANILLPCCFFAGAAEWVRLQDLAAFLDDVEAVGIEVLEGVDLAGGPADFDVSGFGLVEAEVDAEVVLREVASAAADF